MKSNRRWIKLTKGERIKARREELGITQVALADMIGESKQTVYKYESGLVSNIPSDKVELIAKALGVQPEWIMGWDVSSSPIPPGFIPLPKSYKVPLVGRIACGTPITAEENLEGYIDVPVDRQVDFALLCEGDSMVDAGIKNGDAVYIRKQPTVENGQIAAVRINGEATLKRVYQRKYNGAPACKCKLSPAHLFTLRLRRRSHWGARRRLYTLVLVKNE